MHYALVLLILIPLALADVGFDPQKPRCPGGYEEGAEATLGRYFYQCRDGTLEPKGCISDQGRRVELYQTSDMVNSYRLQCVLDSRGFATFDYKSCLYEGREYGVNERWSDDRYIYACLKEGDHLRMIVDGCMYQGREIGINEKVRHINFVYQCKQSENGTCSMCPVGCVSSNQEYMIGDSYEENQYWYTCVNLNGHITIKPNGCVNDGKRFQNGDHFLRNDATYECQIVNDAGSEKLVGCVARDEQGNTVEKRLGDTWTDGGLDYACKNDPGVGRIMKVPIRCNYRSANGVIQVEPGCYRIQEGSAIGCYKEPGRNDMMVKIYRSDAIGRAASLGLRLC